MASSNLQQRLLNHVSGPDFKPVKAKALAKALGVAPEDVRELKQLIKQLVKSKRLAYGPSHVVGLPDAVAFHGVTGNFRRMAAGFGFVRPSGVKAAEGKSQDIYISRKNGGDAASGDTVLVRLQRHQRPGKPGPSGTIVKVIKRETYRFVGVYLESAGSALVQIDGKLFTQPVLVGDPGVKGAHAGDKVVIEMVRFPSHVHKGEGVIVETLGARGDPGVDTLSILHEFNLPGPFLDDVLEAAHAAADAFDESIGDGRRDLTDTTIITIDPKDARDFDDAISLDKLPDGHWRLGVHIADVSHFVRPRTPLDREAKERATSVYLPDRVIPMLPEAISNNLASLQPDHVRYAMTVWIDWTADGVRTNTEVCKSAIKSSRRFTYEEVDDFLERRSAWRDMLEPDVHQLLANMHELAMLLRQRRMTRGCLELSMPEVKIDLDQDGRVAGAHLVENTESHQMIEEFMLAANEAVATLLQDGGWAFLRRVHAAPDPRKLHALTEFVTELGFKTESLESRFAIQTLLENVRDQPAAHAVNYAVLRSMQKAVYSPEEEGHYALASECYCHFTSPIRRYPDLTVHRLLTSMLAGKPPVQDLKRLLSLGEHCSDREQRAAQAERELTKLKLLHYLSERLGEEMVGIITGVEEIGLFVQGVELPAEGLVHVSSLADDYYRFDRTTHTLTGHRSNNRYRLGDTVLVAVAHVDIDRRELDFRLLKRLPGPPKKKPSQKPPWKKPSTQTRSKAKPRPQGKKKTKGRARAKKKTDSQGRRGRGKS